MRADIVLKIKSNPNLFKFLLENSFYFKELIRNPNFINELEKIMRVNYGLTTGDKLKNIGNKLELVKEVMDIIS